MSWATGFQRWLSENESLQNAQLVANHFSDSWTPQAISALCGNMRHESSINPDMYEYGYEWGADRGYGLVQWTPRSKYWNWAVSQGLEPRDGNSQLSRIDYEQAQGIQWIKTTAYPLSFNEFTQSTADVDYLTEAFTWNYERPNRQAGESSMPARKAFARKVLEQITFGQGGGGKPFFPTTEGLPITSPYGWRLHPIHNEMRFHSGIDIGGGGSNPPIYATQSGVVIYNGWTEWGGWGIRIRHTGDSYFSMYIHLNSASPVPVGTNVSKGQEIGTMGTTGDSTGIHLHFEIATSENGFSTENGTIDPELYLQMNFGGGGTPGEGTTKNKLFHLWLSDALPW